MKLIYLIIILFAYSTESLRILSVLPTVARSHYAPTRRIILELLNRGHEVVSISPFEEKNLSENFTWIPVDIKSPFDVVPAIEKDIGKKVPFFIQMQRLWWFAGSYAKAVVKRKAVKDFIEYDRSHFDVILCEEFLQPIFLVFSYKYNAPLVVISSFGPGHYISQYMGNSLELSYVPHEFLDLFGELNFFHRIKNLICTVYDIIGRYINIVNPQEELVKDVFHDLRDVPSLHDLERNVSIVLLNSHFSLSVVRPMLPNIVEIGGVHMEPVKPLKQDLQNILDGARDGAILCSFGSIVELSKQPKNIVLNLLNTLSKLKQRVLVKWNSDEKIPLTFPNIFPFRWLPQNDILAHPNMKLFITHGGLLSAQEAIYHGVPTICVPFFGDQYLNCERSVKLGYGLNLDLDDIQTDLFPKYIQRILEDSTFRDNAKELSARFRDRQNSPLDTAIFWIEYTARHKDMSYIKSPKRNLYWFQYYFIDVGSILLLFAVLVGYFFFKFIELLISIIKKCVKYKID